MRRLLNPENGATITKIPVFGYYDKHEEPFKPGQTLDVPEDVAEYMLKTWEYLEEIPYEKLIVSKSQKQRIIVQKKGKKNEDLT